jgi:hypothetical protein
MRRNGSHYKVHRKFNLYILSGKHNQEKLVTFSHQGRNSEKEKFDHRLAIHMQVHQHWESGKDQTKAQYSLHTS